MTDTFSIHVVVFVLIFFPMEFIEQGPVKFSILIIRSLQTIYQRYRFFVCVQGTKEGNSSCRLFQKQISMSILERNTSVYMCKEGRNQGRPEVSLVDQLIQIQISGYMVDIQISVYVSNELLIHPWPLSFLFFLKLLCVGILRVDFCKISSPVSLSHFKFCVEGLSSVTQLCPTLWTSARQAFLSITNSQSLHKLMFIESVMPSNHLILCCPLLLPPSIFPSIRVFSNELVLCIRYRSIGVSTSASVLPLTIQD